MKKTIKLALLAISAVILAGSSASAFNLDDIQFWAGSGSKSAAMVINWSSPEVFNNTTVVAPVANKTLAWGYKFNGTATALDMFNSICAADSRLFAAMGYGDSAVFALGYDLDNNGSNGIIDGSDDADNSYAVDSNDLYWAGEFGPNWEVWQAGIGTGLDNAPSRGQSTYWTPDNPNEPWSGKHGGWELSWGLSYISLNEGSWVGLSVARGGLEYSNQTAPGTIAYNLHKQAPGSPEAAAVPEPASLVSMLTGLISIGGLALRRRIS